MLIKCSEIRETNEDKVDKFVRHLITGGIAGGVSRTCTAPLDRIKIFFQISQNTPHIISVSRSLITEGGFFGLWRGNLMSVIKSTPRSAIKFACYDHAKTIFRARQEEPLPIWQMFVAASIAGIISQSALYPLDVMKVRMSLRKTGQYSGIVDAMKKIYRREGLRAFGRGYSATILAVIPSAGLDLAGYEVLKKIWLSQNDVENISTRQMFTLGALSTFAAQLVTYPLCMISTVMQASETDSKTKSHTLRAVIREIWQKNRFSGFYKGLVPNILKFMPLSGITFVVYEKCNNFLGIKMV